MSQIDVLLYYINERLSRKAIKILGKLDSNEFIEIESTNEDVRIFVEKFLQDILISRCERSLDYDVIGYLMDKYDDKIDKNCLFYEICQVFREENDSSSYPKHNDRIKYCLERGCILNHNVAINIITKLDLDIIIKYGIRDANYTELIEAVCVEKICEAYFPIIDYFVENGGKFTDQSVYYFISDNIPGSISFLNKYIDPEAALISYLRYRITSDDIDIYKSFLNECVDVIPIITDVINKKIDN